MNIAWFIRWPATETRDGDHHSMPFPLSIETFSSPPSPQHLESLRSAAGVYRETFGCRRDEVPVLLLVTCERMCRRRGTLRCRKAPPSKASPFGWFRPSVWVLHASGAAVNNRPCSEAGPRLNEPDGLGKTPPWPREGEAIYLFTLRRRFRAALRTEPSSHGRFPAA
jgi:hypothetical protein